MAANNPIFVLDEKPASTSRKVHIQRLNDILHLSLERGDLPRARRAWSILARCKEFDWKTKWRTSLLVLPDTSVSFHLQQSNGRSIELLKKLMLFHPEDQESILQEIVLNLANMGNFKEALDEIELYLPLFPYQDNPILHTYAGLMSLELATSPPSEGRVQSTPNSNFLREAQNHFARVLSLDSSNVVAEAFMEEINKQLTRANATTSDDALSEEEMDGEHDDQSTRVKRAKRSVNKE